MSYSLSRHDMHGVWLVLCLLLAKCSLHEAIPLEQLYSEECPLQKNMLWRKCSGLFSIKFTFTVPIYCPTFVAPQTQDFSLFNSTQISLDTLYSDSCPLNSSEKYIPCSATFPNKSTEKAAIQCSEDERTADISHNTSEDTTTKNIINSIKREVFESKMQFHGLRARLVKLISKNDTDKGIYVEFAVAPSRCSSEMEVSGLVEPSQAEKAVETIKTFISNVQIQINGSHARAVKIYRYQPLDSGIYVEFSVTQSACNASEKISISSLYSRRCPVLPAEYWILCSGMLPFSPWDKHSITCGERIEPDPNLPEDEPEPTVDERTGAFETTNSTDLRNTSGIVSSIKLLMFSSNIRTNGSPARLVRLNSQEVKEDSIDIKVTAAPAKCSKDEVTLDELYSDNCPIDRTQSWMLCYGSIPLNEKGRLNFECNETVEPEAIGKAEPPSVNTTTGQPEATIVVGEVDLPSATAKIRRMVHESNVQFGGWHARLVKVIEVNATANGSIFARFAIAPCECNAELKKESSTTLNNTNASRLAEIETALQTVRRFIFNVKIEVNGSYARVVKLYKVQNYKDEIYVEFAIAQSGCKATKTPSLEALYSKYCPVLPSDHWLLCIGLLSHSSDSGYSMTCQGRIEAEPLPPDNEPPATVKDPNEEPDEKTHSPTPAHDLDEIRTSIKRFLMSSNIDLNGSYPRLVKLRKEENKNYVEFVIAPTNCSRQREISLDKLYSNQCPVDYKNPWVICAGARNAVSQEFFGVACNNVTEPDKQEQPQPPVTTPSPEIKPQSKVPTDEEMASLIRRSVFESSVQFGGWHARFVKLIKSNMVNDDIEAEFAVAPSGCSSELKVSLEMLYSPECPVLNVSEWLVCGGTLPRDSESTYLITCGARMKADQSGHSGQATALEDQSTRSDVAQMTEAQKAIEAIKRFVFNVRIEVNGSYARMMKLYRFDTEGSGILVEFSIAQSACPISTKGIDLNRLDQYTPNKTNPHEIAEASSIIKSFLHKSRIEMNGSYVRLLKLLKHVATPTETYAEFSIAATNCSRDTEVDLDTLYSDQCPVVETDRWIICRGAVRAQGKEQYNVVCNETAQPDKQGILTSTPAPDVLTTRNLSDPEQVSLLIVKYLWESKADISGWHAKFVKLLGLQNVQEDTFATFALAPSGCRHDLKVSLNQLYSAACPLLNVTQWIVCNGTLPRNPEDPYLFKCNDRMSAEQTDSESRSGFEDFISTSLSANNSEIMQSIETVKLFIFNVRLEINGSYARLTKLYRFEPVTDGVLVEFAISQSACNTTDQIEIEKLYSSSCPLVPVDYWVLCRGKVPLLPYNKHSVSCNERIEVDPELHDQSRDLTFEAVNPLRVNTTIDILQVTETLRKFIYESHIDIEGSYGKLTRLHSYEVKPAGVDIQFSIMKSSCSQNKPITIEELYSEQCSIVQSPYSVHCGGILPIDGKGQYNIKCEKIIQAENNGGSIITPGVSTPAPEPTTTEPSSALNPNDHAAIIDYVKYLMFSEEININGWYPRFLELLESYNKDGRVYVKYLIAPSECPSNRKVPIEYIYSESCAVRDVGVRIVCDGLIPLRNGDFINCRIDEEKDNDSKQVQTEATDQDDSLSKKMTEYLKRLLYIERLNIDGWYPRLVKILETRDAGDKVHLLFNITASGCRIGENTVYMPPFVQATPHYDSQMDSMSITISIKNVIFPDGTDLESCKENFMKIKVSDPVPGGIYVVFTVDPSKCAERIETHLRKLCSSNCSIPGPNVVYRCRALVPLHNGIVHKIECEVEKATDV
ncbi:hypothetical protein TTRE_0000507901 [Trichuris trichiura]|uniref:Uncharacterized protein n=1 Tax=Trichuris trichiura TaxID=36087 RepID=A0A077Z8L5_TRITR|nr:hypothetical protein TTRE_0000507901 [Trichuris trichiura]